MRWHYRTLGLSLASDVPLDGLLSAVSAGQVPRPVDVEISTTDDRAHFSNVPPFYISPYRTPAAEPVLTAFRGEGGSLFLRYGGGIDFSVAADGHFVQAYGVGPERLELFRTALLGQVIGVVLRLKHVICLHASAVAVAGRGVAFAGPVGAGKSTTAAALARYGFPLLSDDVTTLWPHGPNFMAEPAGPWLRLWTGSRAVLETEASDLVEPLPSNRKARLAIRELDLPFQATPMALLVIYILSPRQVDLTAPIIESLSGRDALMALTANSYLNYLLDTAMRAEEFSVFGKLIQNIAVRRLTAPAQLQQLSQLCEAVKQDVMNCT